MQATKEEMNSSLALIQNRVGQVETDLETTQTSFETDIDANRNTLLSLTSKQIIYSTFPILSSSFINNISNNSR